MFVPQLLGGSGAIVMTEAGTELIGGTSAGRVASAIAAFSKTPLVKDKLDKFIDFEVHVIEKIIGKRGNVSYQLSTLS